jgi:hypothetical protein
MGADNAACVNGFLKEIKVEKRWIELDKKRKELDDLIAFSEAALVITLLGILILSGCSCKPGTDAVTQTVCTAN